MSELASVHLRQARQFMQSGNWPQALALLEKSRVLSRDNRELMIPVLRDLAQTYDALGRGDMSAQCRDRLSRLAPPTPPPMPLACPPRNAALCFAMPSERTLRLTAAGIIVALGLGMMAYYALRQAPATPPAPVAHNAADRPR